VTKRGISEEKTKNIKIVDRMLNASEGSLNANKAARRGRAAVQSEFNDKSSSRGRK